MVYPDCCCSAQTFAPTSDRTSGDKSTDSSRHRYAVRQAKLTTAVAAIREEARTTLWNPRYLQGVQREGATTAATLTETVRNMYGWNVIQPSSISGRMWDEPHQVMIEDRHQLGMREFFEKKNPCGGK